MVFENIELPSDRKFGIFFTMVFLGSAVYFYSSGSQGVAYILVSIGLVVFAVTSTKPSILHPFNKLWMLFGFAIGKIVSPIVLGAMFFLIITPVAVCARVLGRDELRLKMVDRPSHWKLRNPIGPESASFKKQY